MTRPIIKNLIDLFIPRSCFGCGKPSQYPLCQSCYEALVFLKKPVCQKCGYPTLKEVETCRQCRGKKLYFKQAVSLLSYETKAKDLLIGLKSASAFSLIDFFVQNAISNQSRYFSKIEAVTYIPTTVIKKVKRGHNVSRMIAESFGYHLKLPAVETLKFSRKVKDQAGLDINQRQVNMHDVFKAAEMDSLLKTILLVDDIYTTGSTVNEAAKTLKGVDVRVFTIAKTL